MKKIFTLKFNVNTYNRKNGKVEFSKFVKKQKNNLIEAPDYCVENILNFARSYRVAESKSTGKVEMILN
jgi:hypothetical protein